MLRIIDRKPRIYSPQVTGSGAWVSYNLSSHSVTVKCPLVFPDLTQLK